MRKKFLLMMLTLLFVAIGSNGKLFAQNVAKVDDAEYATIEAAFAAATEGQTVTLLADAAPALTSQKTITKAAVIDLNGKKLTLKEDDLYFGTTEFKNGTIVVDESVVASTAVFWMFENQTLTFDNVDIVATGVTGTYLIGINGGTGTAVNLLNGSSITIGNADIAGLTAVICDNGTGNNVTIDDSKIDVKNIEGRFYLGGKNGKVVVENTDVDLNGVKEGFYLRAGQTLDITGPSTIDITLNSDEGRYGINVTDMTATYTVGEDAIVNATVMDPVVAKIGNEKFASLDLAFSAANDGDEVKILKAGTYALSTSGKNLTITANVQGVEFANIGAKNMGGANVTFNNVTFTYANNSTYKGLQHSGILVYNNCTINGQVFLYGQSETFNNCTFSTTDSNNYNVWTYGAKVVVFNECTFNCAGKSVLIYNEQANVENNVTVTKSHFNASQAVEGKAAIEMDSSLQGAITLTIDGETAATGFGKGNVSGNSLWNNKKGNDTEANNDITVTVAGEVVLKPVSLYSVSTKAELNGAISSAQDGDIIKMTADIDYGTDQLAVAKAITLDLGGKTLTTRNAYGGMSIKNNPTIKNGTIVHASNTAAIKVWNATAFESLVIDVQGKGDANKTIGGIVLQSDPTTCVGLIKNVTIKGAALTNGIETYNCGDATANVIGAMENVTINAVGTGMLISAPCGTATNCSISGGVNGIEIWIKGNYSASLGLVDCDVVGGVYAHDEFSSNPSIVNNGTLSLVADEATTGADAEDITLEIARAENIAGVLKDYMDKAEAKIGNTYYATLAEAIAAVGSGDVVIKLVNDAALSYGAREAYGVSETSSLTIEGNGKVLTLNQTNSDWSSFGLANADAKVVFKTMTIEKTGKGDTSGAWNTHAIIFSTDVEMEDVTVNNAIAVAADATLTGVTINEANGYYGLWIEANGQEVIMKGGSITATNGGRGIKIADQYIDTPAKVTLNVDGTVFETAKKAAVLVSSTAGAKITASSVNIANVAEDKVNFVWVDEDWAANFSNVEVIGATVAQEGIKNFVAAVSSNNNIIAYYQTLSAAVNAVQNGETIVLLNNITENVTLTEKVGLYYTIDGNGKTMNGNITITALSDTNDNRRITIKNINFIDETTAKVDFITSTQTNHYPRLTVESCSFTGNGDNGDVALRLKSSHSVVVKNCTGTGLHSFLQNTSGWNLTVNNVTVTNSKSGLALGTVQGVTVQGCNIDVNGYGIRLDAGYNNNAVIESNTVKAFIPVVVRNASVDSNITFQGSNTMTATNTDGYWCAIGTSEYEANGQLPTAATGKVRVTLKDAALNVEGIYGYTLDGEGTETAPYLINNINDLVAFRNNVDKQAADGSTQYAGKYIKLTADIDLDGINWNPIGSKTGDHASFKGVFDGDNHTISNLYVEQNGEGLGLFAYTSGNAVIKNLKLNNVTVKSTNNSSYVGGVVGNAYASTKIENVHVSGDVLISGRGYIGGIAGHGYVVMDNVSVVANEGGLITSTFWCAGGILGYAGEGVTDIKNAHVEGLTITSAAGGLGSIVGMAEDNNGTQPISGSNLSAKNVEIKTYVGGYGTSYEDYAIGYLYGGNPTSKLTGDLDVEEVTIVNASGNFPSIISDAVANINGNIYFNLANAIAVADGNTVVLLKDVNDALTVSKPANDININGNNKTVKGGMTFGSDNNKLDDYNIVIKNVNFVDRGLSVKELTNVTISNNTFSNITEGNAITVICDNLTETVNVSGNTINNVSKGTGIRIRKAKAAVVVANEIDGIFNNAILFEGETSGDVDVTNNVLKNWGKDTEGKGRAIRIVKGADTKATITRNVMIHDNAPEEFVKVSSNTEDVNIDANYWNGNNPIETAQCYDVANVYPGNYYSDEALETLVTITYVAQIGTAKYASLQAAVNAVQNGETITLIADITENVTVSQVEGLSFVIYGDNKNFDGTITLDGNSRNSGAETLTIQNVNFVTSTIGRYFVEANDASADNRYSHNVTVKDCNFTATEGSDAVQNAVAARFRQAYNIKIEGGTFTNLHSVLQAYGCLGIEVTGVKTVDCKSGVSFGTSQNAAIKDVELYATAYGVRADAETNTTLTIENAKINAFIPVVVRKASAEYNITFNGENTMNANNTDDYWCVIGTSEYEANGELPTAATGKVRVTLNDADLEAEGVYGNFAPVVLKNEDDKIIDFCDDIEDALDVVKEGEIIEIVSNAIDESKKEIEFTKDITFTITGNAPDYKFPVITFQNATVYIKDATIKTPELDARQNATINVINSTVYGVGSNDIIKSYYNGAINIDETSTVYTMQVTTMGYITVAGTLNATWQTNVYGNGLITLNDGANFNTAALHLTAKDYSGRDNTDKERVGKPAEITVNNGADFTVGKVYASSGADYSYNSSKGINIGTIEGKCAILNINEGAEVNIYMADGQTANIGVGGTVNINASTMKTICRSESGTVGLNNNGIINFTSDAAILETSTEGLTIGYNLDQDKKVVYKEGKYQVVDKVYVAQIEDKNYETLAEAFQAAEANQIITLINNVTEVFEIKNEKEVTLNMGEFTLTGAILPSKANLTINGGTIANSDKSHSAIEINAGSLVLNDVNISSARHAIRIDGNVDVTVNGGTYVVNEYAANNTRHALNVSNGADVTIVDGTFIGPKGASSDSGSAIKVQANSNVVIKNGNFSGGKDKTVSVNGTLSISGGIFDQDVNDYCAEGYVAFNISENIWTVDIAVATVNGKSYIDFQAAIDAAGTTPTTITVVAGFATEASYTIAKGQNITLDLNGMKITGTDKTSKNFGLIQNNGTLTIADNGSRAETGTLELTAAVNSGWNRYSAVISNNPGATLTVNGGLIQHLGGTDMAYGIDALTNGGIGDVNTTINGGTILSTYRAIRQFLNSNSKENNLVINGGTIEGANKGIFFHDPSTKANKGQLLIGGSATVNSAYLYVTAGSTEWPVEVVIVGDAIGEVTSANIPEGYLLVFENGLYTVETIGVKEQTFNLKNGWTWVSLCVDATATEDLTSFESQLAQYNVDQQIVQIKNQTKAVTYQQYYDSYGWYGDLESLAVNDMYMVKIEKDNVVVTLEDYKVNPADYEYNLGSGWTWLGFPSVSNEPIALDYALQNITPNKNDQIKSQTGFATYINNKWYGTLENMTPGMGYMYKNTSGETITLVYPAESNYRGVAPANITAENNLMVPNMSKYAYNMSIIAVVNIDGEELMSEDFEVAAFAGNELRGSARPIYVEDFNSYMIFMTVYGEANEELTFKYYDLNNGEEHGLFADNMVKFEINATVGSLEEALVLNYGTLSVDESLLNGFNVYPNPVNRDNAIEFETTFDKVEVYNSLGVVVAEYANVDRIDGIETTGIYVIKVTNDNVVKHCRVIVK